MIDGVVRVPIRDWLGGRGISPGRGAVVAFIACRERDIVPCSRDMAIAAIWPSAAGIVIDNAYVSRLLRPGAVAIVVRVPAGCAGIRHEGDIVGMSMAEPAVPAGVGTAGIQGSYNA